MNIAFKLYRVFTDLDLGFVGNTSPVFVLDQELTTQQMQAIASDLWQPASTFLWRSHNQWNVRWFAPDQEIDLCGHGSLAAIALLTSDEQPDAAFYAKGLKISGNRNDNGSCSIILDAIEINGEITDNLHLENALGIPVLGNYANDNKHIVLTDCEASVRDMKPNFEKLRESSVFGYAVTAQGDKVDFVSRTLVPHVHQLEDPATGSSHAALGPFWGKRLGKQQLTSHQLSKRGGKFLISLSDNQVHLSGDYQVLGEGKVTLT
ncbi:MAG: PhzF family phenazine biosynthesis protein [Cyclobacteriaceae bacterium]